MNTTKRNSIGVAIGLALGIASLSVLAQPVANPARAGAVSIINNELGLAGRPKTTPPTFNRAEQTGLCLLESVVSLLAARTNDFGCGPATYSLSVYTTDSAGEGVAEIDGGVGNGGTTLNATLGRPYDIGTACTVTAESGTNRLKGVTLVEYDGDHGWSRTKEIFNSDAYITLIDPQTGSDNLYREVNIKDYFKRVINGKSWEFDWGLEDIKKNRYDPGVDLVDPYLPVQKWHEISWYNHENGGEGSIWVKKYLVIPRSARGCRIEYTSSDQFNGSSEFETNGTVKVFRASPNSPL